MKIFLNQRLKSYVMKNCLYILYIGLMGFMASSCQQSLEEEVQLPPTLGKAQLSFTIALDDFGSRSRASWKDNDDASGSVSGTVYENQINLTSEDALQVFVYDLDDNLLGEVTDKDVFKLSDNTYKFNGSLELENLKSETLECLLKVYANCMNSTDFFAYNVDYIPMWGVKKTTLNLAKGELTNIVDPICLLRAMAKVEVKLDATLAKDFDLKSVEIDKYNAIGNVLPAYEATVDTENMDSQAVFNPNIEIIGTNLDLTEVANDEFCIYLPEYRNVGEDTTPASMTVVINDKEYTIEFRDYVDGQATVNAYNIVRNHYYQYTITSVNTEENVILTNLSYQVMSWQNIDNGVLYFGNDNGNVMN